MNPFILYFLLQVIGIYSMLILLDYYKNAEAHFPDLRKTTAKSESCKKEVSLEKSKAA